jgi:hypothetical protein
MRWGQPKTLDRQDGLKKRSLPPCPVDKSDACVPDGSSGIESVGEGAPNQPYESDRRWRAALPHLLALGRDIVNVTPVAGFVTDSRAVSQDESRCAHSVVADVTWNPRRQ